ncbi:Drought-responsive family protein [Corchorus capsularis]|uniref:Drought-responsive family protein n=1 Tax=Corchorus capsularis TaxID=210143 RepID=A0A1R3JL96_COCAP|nr:Drought-responsive family protein [Corchorus capsularis]
MTIYTEDDSKHSELLENLQRKILEYQEILNKIKASKLKGMCLYSSSGDSRSNRRDEYEDGDEDKDRELDYENYGDKDGHYDNFEDEDTRACFPCPFCYVEIEIHSLCNHLQEEHCFDLRNAVCPLCAANLGKDVIGHFIVQHASSLKRRRKSQKAGHWPGSPATLGRELSSFMGSSTGGRGNAHESAPDPLLSPFLCNAPVSATKDIQRDKCSDDETSFASNLKRTEPPSSDKDGEENTEERRQRAAFAQQLVMSTIF